MGGYLPPMFDPAKRRLWDQSIATPPFLPPDMAEPPDLPPATVPVAQGVPTADDWEDPVAGAEAAYERELGTAPAMKKVPWWRKVLAGVADKNVLTSGTELGPWLRYGSENMRRMRASEAGKNLAKTKVEIAREAAKRKADREKALREGYEAETGRMGEHTDQYKAERGEAELQRSRPFRDIESAAKGGLQPTDAAIPGGFQREPRDPTVVAPESSVIMPPGEEPPVFHQSPGRTPTPPAYYPEGAAIPQPDGSLKRVPKLASPDKPERVPTHVGGRIRSDLAGQFEPPREDGGDEATIRQANAWYAREKAVALEQFQEKVANAEGDEAARVKAQRDYERAIDLARSSYQMWVGQPPTDEPVPTGMEIAAPEAGTKVFGFEFGEKPERLIPADEPPVLPGTTAAPSAKAAPTSPQTTADQEIRDALLAEDPTMTAEELERAIAAYKQIQ